MFDVLIIGAGISGLTAALNLKKMGKTVAVFDKGNGVGGRTATRRVSVGDVEYAFDYGCSEFQISDPRAVEWFSHLQSVPEFPLIKRGSDGLYFEHGMRSLAEWMAGELTDNAEENRLFKRTKITSVEFEEHQWIVSNGDASWQGQHLIITTPAPQAVELLKNSSVNDSIVHDLKSIRYQPSWVVLTTFEQQIPADLLSEFIHFDPDLVSVVDNYRRGVSEGFACNFHFANSWSRDYLEATCDQVEHDFIRRWNRKMSAFPLQTLKAHRWRYAFPIVDGAMGQAVLADNDHRFLYGSDALISPSIEGAVLAGLFLSDEF